MRFHREGLKMSIQYNSNRKKHPCLILVTFGLILLASFFTFSDLYGKSNNTSAEYFAAACSGKLDSVSLTQPLLTEAVLLQWATKAAIASNSYNYVNYREAFEGIRIYYTEIGYKKFLKELSESDNVRAVAHKKFIVSSALRGDAIITKKGVSNNIFIWDVQLPLEITFNGHTETFKQNIIVNMRISRVQPLEYCSEVVNIDTYIIAK